MIYHVLRRVPNEAFGVADFESYIDRRGYLPAKDDSLELRGLRAVARAVLSDNRTGTEASAEEGVEDAFNLLATLYSVYMLKLVKASRAPAHQ